MPPPEQSGAAALHAEINGNGPIGDDRQRLEDVESDEEEDIFTPEFRLVNRDDPEAYAFNTPKYSAHKLPKDVVDASVDGPAGLQEFMGTWREIVRRQEDEDTANEAPNINGSS